VSTRFHAPVEDPRRPVRGGVAAFRLEQVAGHWKLVPAWLSRDMDMAEEAVVANGVLFAYGSGEDTLQALPEKSWDNAPPGGRGSPCCDWKIAGSTHITLFALDTSTGKELWNSGNQIASWSHYSGISAANGRVYVPSFDGTLYCFGMAK
jgi:outer membrane protein assembly factor BamB